MADIENTIEDVESPEEGEIQDDSSDEESCETTSRHNKYYGVGKDKYIAPPACTSVEVRRSSRLRKSGGRDPHPEPAVPARIGYPVCVQDVYKSYDNFQPVLDTRNEKENKISRQPRRISTASPLPEYTPKAIERRYESVKMSNRSRGTHRKQRRHLSEDKRKSKSKQKKVAAVGKDDDIFIISDSSDIEVQIQKTKKRLQNENFNLEHLIGHKAIPSTLTASTTLDTLDLNKSSSSLEIIEEKLKTNPPIVKIAEPKNTSNVKVGNTEDKKEEWILRADALKSVIVGKYANKKKKDKSTVSENAKEGDFETSPAAPSIETSNEPVDMEISLTDDEHELSVVELETQKKAKEPELCPMSTEVYDQLVVVDEVGCSPKSQHTDEPKVGLEEEDEELLRAQLLIAISSKQKPIPSETIIPKKLNPPKPSVQLAQISSTIEKQIPQKLKALPPSRSLSAKANPYRFNKNAKKLIYSSKRIKKLPGKNVKQLLKKLNKQTVPSLAALNKPDGGNQQKMLASKSYLDDNRTKLVTSPILPTAGRIVIRLGEDTDTDEEMGTPPKAVPEPAKVVPPADLMKSVDEFLKQVRQNVEQKQHPQAIPPLSEEAQKSNLGNTNLDPKNVTSNSKLPSFELDATCSPNLAETSLEKQFKPSDNSVRSVVKVSSSDLTCTQSSLNAVIKSNENSSSSPARDQVKEKTTKLPLYAVKTAKTTKPPLTSKKTPLLPTPKLPLLPSPDITSLVTAPIPKKTVSTKLGSTKITFNTKTDESSSGTLPTKGSTPQVLRHLTSSQQREYKRLILEIARREELRKLKARLGQPVSKMTSTREGVLSDQPKLKITVRNSSGGEDDLSFRTVRQTESENEERSVSINQDQASESAVLCETEAENEERTVCIAAENKKSVNDAEENIEKNSSENVESSVEMNKESEEASKQTSGVADTALGLEHQPPVDEAHGKKTENPFKKETDKRSAPANSKSMEPKKKRQRPSAQKKISSATLLKLPEDERKTKLSSTELELFSKRKEMLTQLTQLASFLTDMEQSQAQTVDAEARVEALKRELARAETRAEEQRNKIKKLYTQVSQLRIEVAQTRIHCSGLSQTCQILGQSTQGSAYHVPQAGAELLKTHLQQVVELTKRAKRTVPPLCQSSPTLPSNCSSTQSSASFSNSPSSVLSPKMVDDNNVIDTMSDQKFPKTVLPLSVSVPPSAIEFKSGESISHPSPLEDPNKRTYLRVKSLKSLMEADCSDTSKDTVASELKLSTKLNPDLSSLSTLINLPPPSCPSLRPYTSPLEHMKPKFRLQQQDDAVDPNKIMCPYALSGTCLDDECSFQHPRPSSTL